MEPNVTQRRREKGVNDFEGLDGAVEVLVIDGVFIVVHPGIRSRHLVTNEENAVISRIRFNSVDGRAGPRGDGGFRLHSGTDG